MIHHEHLKNITKTEKYKKLNMTEHRADVNITEKLNSTSMTEHKKECNYTLAAQHFYEGTLNRTQLHFGEHNCTNQTNLKTPNEKG